MITDNKFLEQAKQFLQEANAKIDIEFLEVGINPNWKKTEEEKRNIYKFTISTPKGSYSSKFYGSINEYEEIQRINFALNKNAHPVNKFYKYKNNGYSKKELLTKLEELKINEYDILACLDGYHPGDFEDFCANYGYDEDSRTAEKIYNEVIKQYLGIVRIFTNEQLEKLQEIN